MAENPRINLPQHRFLQLPHKYKAYVAGFGSGKTWVGSIGEIKHLLKHPKVHAGYFAPTYKLVRDVFYPTIEEVAYTMQCTVKVRTGSHEVDIYRSGFYYGTIICRTMDNPGNIVGFKIGHALVDELDVMDAVKAEQAWNKIIARLRFDIPGVRNGIDVTTTPEGFRFVYQKFKKQPTPSYGLIQASTYDNEANLPDDYIPSLLESYPPELIKAYLNGMFVNLTSGCVYPDFDRQYNHTSETIEPGEDLHIGMDFNVGKMSATVNVIRNGLPRQLAEHYKVRDTPTMAKLIKETYVDRGHKVYIYPDSSGKNTSSKNAAQSDISILRDAGLSVIAKKSNPRVKDRVNSMNGAFCNAKGERKFLVNVDNCPESVDCYEQQVWSTSGEPDKSQDKDHLPDAQGYFIHAKYPVSKPVIHVPFQFAIG